MQDKQIPLCVDLDNSFIKSDVLHEQLIYTLIRQPLTFLKAFFFLVTRGKANMKSFLAMSVDLPYELIPVNTELLSFLKEQKSQGREILLVTATNERVASSLSWEYTFFDRVCGSSSILNLKGQNKKKFLVESFGENGFDYVGDHSADITIWKSSRKAYLVGTGVNPDKISNLDKTFENKKNSFKLIIKQIRVYQWVKNILLFTPLILAHDFFNLASWKILGVSFFAFSLTASSVYVLNDLADLFNDRAHRTKKFRPLASGGVSIPFAMMLLVLMLSGSMAISFQISTYFAITLMSYFVLNLMYSFFLKKVAILDVFLLSFFYIVRIFAGAIAVNVVVSPWLVVFSFFFFLSLGFLKRYSEVYLNYHKEGKASSSGRAYTYSDANALFIFGVGSSFLFSLVLCQYVFQAQNSALYKSPGTLWLVSGLLLGWMLEVWLRATKGLVKEDPVKFILTDKKSVFVFVIVLLLFILSSL